MRINSYIFSLAACVALVLVSRTARGQLDATPYYPIGSEEDFQPFQPFEWAPYSDPSPLREGWFFSFERYVSFINAPKKTSIGKENLTAIVAAGDGFRIERNTHDTGYLNAGEAWGNRYTFGLNEGNGGWAVTIYDGQPQDTIRDYRNVDVVFNDPRFGQFGTGHLDGWVKYDPTGTNNPAQPDADLDGDGIFGRFADGGNSAIPGGPPQFDGLVQANNINDLIDNPLDYDFDDLMRLPVLFTQMRVRNKAYMDGVELMRVHNVPWVSNDCNRIEFEWGVRFFKFRDRFNVLAGGGILDQSFWNTLADNHVVGPQIGVHWRQRRGRLELDTLGRFLAGFNFQTLKQDGALGSNLGPVPPTPVLGRPANSPAFFDPTSFNHAAHQNEFAPSAELRIDVRYYLTSEFSVKAGWTGQYSYGIVRASNAVDYTLPVMGLRIDNTNQSLWMNFATFGFEWNR